MGKKINAGIFWLILLFLANITTPWFLVESFALNDSVVPICLTETPAVYPCTQFGWIVVANGLLMFPIIGVQLIRDLKHWLKSLMTDIHQQVSRIHRNLSVSKLHTMHASSLLHSIFIDILN